MKPDHESCYQAVLARDARYDGLFFICVKTTGIYCRPICPARHPRPENCVFVSSAAAAQEAGFRPCLRCRPESSPDLGAWRGASATVSRAMALIEDGALDGGDVEALAGRLGVGERQLRRLFRVHIGASPITVAQTRRVLLAKQLIHQTGLSMTEVALASGFGSVRRFNETFQQLYDRPPIELRRQSVSTRSSAPGITLLLPYRPPYDWTGMIGFLKTRAIPGLELVTERTYARVIAFDGLAGSIEVTDVPNRSALRATVRFPRLELLPKIIARIRRCFDLGADPVAISAALGRDPTLAPLVEARPGLRVPGAWDGLEIAIRAVLGQQITVAAGTRLAGKLVATLGTDVADRIGLPGLTHTFPDPARMVFEAVATLGLPRVRAATIAALAAAAHADPHLFDARQDLDDAIARFRTLPGIGEWTAQYVAMRVLRESDAFLAADVALQRILATGGKRPNARELLARAECWRPWRAYAVLHLWTDEASVLPGSRPLRQRSKENAYAISA
ncbi:MAG: AlkA N-terminal domain-containing protein [Acetobacteraceae bacterium]|jgi:AraC family transcriptional regulator of adaptative response / DNA-3-methyladenine glycosylase II